MTKQFDTVHLFTVQFDEAPEYLEFHFDPKESYLPWEIIIKDEMGFGNSEYFSVKEKALERIMEILSKSVPEEETLYPMEYLWGSEENKEAL